MASKDCIFCRIIRNELSGHKVFEDSDFLAILDKYPVNFGHTLIIPKVHVEKIEYLDPASVQSLFALVHRLVKPVQLSVGAPACTISINNGPEAGQVIPHVHVHIVPRFKRDEDASIHSGSRRHLELDGSKMSEIAKRIHSEIVILAGASQK